MPARARLSLVVLTPLFLILAAGSPLAAQSDIEWIDGPATGRLGNVAQILVPEGYRFSGVKGAVRFLELTENIPTGREVGVLIPNVESDSAFWFVIFEFDPSGYVKDEDKHELDADKLLKTITKGNEAANKVRRERGWTTMRIVGWEKPPFYDEKTNNLTWAIRGAVDEGADAGETVNYSTRVLGRRGTMNVDLVLGPGMVEAVVPEFEWLMEDFAYLPGNRYAEWVEGDPVAAYGLTALVAGGAGALALKSGLLQKFGKVIVLGALALLGAIGKMFKSVGRLFGRREDEQPATQPS